jgi:hypothetical protein
MRAARSSCFGGTIIHSSRCSFFFGGGDFVVLS